MEIKEIHTFEFRGKKFLLDVSTSRFFRIDALTEELVDLLSRSHGNGDLSALKSKYGTGDVEGAIRELRDGGVVADRIKPSARLLPIDDTRITDICLNVSHNCNLRCKYCYGDSGA
jgi:uncharacterized protein